jgi:gliding motility-associated-like protein
MIKIYYKLKKSNKKLIILGLLIFINLELIGQNEFNNWYFGYNCGVTFNTSPPSAMTNGAVSCYDQTSTYSDASGNLLMYSDGRTIYNRNHVAMPNGTGLLGSSNPYSHASVVLRKPGSNNLFYIFTLTYFGYSQGLQYAIIDMNLQGGLGDVISKNNQLVTPVCEKLTAVRHQNGTDIWIITHRWETDAFYAYLLTSSGVSSPVITHIGPIHSGGSGSGYNAAGQLVASVNGDKLALATYEMGFYGVYDFNKATGVVSNEIQITGYTRSWGVAFSPDGTKLYATKWTYAPVYQFNLLAGNATAITNSAVIIGTTTSPDAGYKAGFMQLGPDGKIYIAKMNAGYLACINNPNASGTLCNFVDNAIFLSGKTCQAGLPIFNMSEWAITDFTPQNACEGSTVNFSCQGYLGFSSCLWIFGDTLSGANNQSTLINTTHTYNNSGTYTVTLITQQGSFFDTIQHQIIIYSKPQVNIGPDTSLCSGNILTLNAGNPGASYFWTPGGTTAQTINVNTTGQYIVQVTNAYSCVKKDTVNVTVNPTPFVDLGNDTAFCQGGLLFLNAGNPGGFYQWTPGGATTQMISVNSSGQYIVQVTNAFSCVKKDTVNITVKPTPIVNLGNDTTFCQGNTITLNAGNPGSSYLWFPGSATSQTIPVTASGQYIAQVTNSSNCVKRDTINIMVNPSPSVNLGNDTAICQGNQLILNAGNPGAFYLWTPGGATTQMIYANSSGQYIAHVTNTNNCTDQDTINIVVNPNPIVNLGHDTAFCQGGQLLLNAANSGASYLWSNATTAQTLNVGSTGNYWVEVTNAYLCKDRDSIHINVVPYANATINAVNPLCKNNATLTLTAANTGGVWNGQGITNSASGLFNPSVADTGTHLITYSINGLCGDSDSIYIKVLPSPTAYADTVRPSCPDFQNGSIILHASGGTPPYSYFWSGSSSGDTLINLGNGQYTVTVSDANNCKQVISVLFDVTIIDCIPTVIYVPNVFSPNGDGANDVVYVHGEMVKELTFIIYDRWGEKIFETNDISQGWDGTFRGKKMPQAVYAYYLKVSGANNTEIIKKGNISLVR